MCACGGHLWFVVGWLAGCCGGGLYVACGWLLWVLSLLQLLLMHTVCSSTVHASAVISQSLLVGTGNLTRRGRATDALPYRDAVAQRLELREPAFGREAQPVITLLDKEASG